MKRDFELIRQILFCFEKSPAARISRRAVNVPNYSREQVDFHLELMIEAGLLDEEIVQPEVSDGSKMYSRFNFGARPTMAGYELLDDIRDEEIWQKTKLGLQKVGSFSLDILAKLAKEYVAQKVRETTG